MDTSVVMETEATDVSKAISSVQDASITTTTAFDDASIDSTALIPATTASTLTTTTLTPKTTALTPATTESTSKTTASKTTALTPETAALTTTTSFL